MKTFRRSYSALPQFQTFKEYSNFRSGPHTAGNSRSLPGGFCPFCGDAPIHLKVNRSRGVATRSPEKYPHRVDSVLLFVSKGIWRREREAVSNRGGRPSWDHGAADYWHILRVL